MSPEQAAQANLLCSVKQIQMVRQSLLAVIEMVTLQRYHFAHYKRGLYLALQALRTLLAVYGLEQCGRHVLHMKKSPPSAPVSLIPAVGDKWTIHQGSAERSPCYSVSLVQRVCFIFQLRRQASIDE